MCEFVSWIKKDNTVIFLTGDDVFHSKRGKELQKYSQDPDDLSGHGAIRWFYDFTGGVDKECTDFTTPDNFPKKIVKAIKSGKMRGLGISKQLLTKQAYAEYEKIWRLALAKYEKIEQPAFAKYEKIRQLALAKYKKIRRLAWAEYKKIEQRAYAEYEKIRQRAFWDLFNNEKNRSKAWC